MQIPADLSKPRDGQRDSPRVPRQDGGDARQRLLGCGLRLFAQQGYAKTSTRELAEAAGANIASISYYFGDKAGLYRAVFFEPHGAPCDLGEACSAPGLSLDQALKRLYAGFLEPLQQGDVARLRMKLHYREMLEPTGLWEEEITHSIQPMHEALLALLCRHFSLAQPDDELRRLAVCIAGLGVHMHVGHDVINRLAPQLYDSAEALQLWAQRLQMYALAMVDAETRRRRAGVPS
jgi:AcrR family transcriptional regulator